QLRVRADMNKVSYKIRNLKLNRVDQNGAKSHPQVFLLPMSKFHLYSDFENGVIVGRSAQFVWMYGIIGAFVLLLACINFMNLATARSEKRAKEVGIRKTIGSLRSQLITQFLSESVLLALISLAFALLLVRITLPFFNQLSAKDIHLPWASPLF